LILKANVDVRFPVYLDYAHDVVGPNFDPCTWDPCNPLYQVSDGNPLAKSDEAGVPAGAVSDFSICVGRLDQDAPAKGVAQKLCDIQLAQGSAAYTDVTIAADDLRGGVVGSVFAVTVPGAPVRVNFGPTDCFVVGMVDALGHTVTAADVSQWVAWGKPDCWCYDCFAAGDLNGDCAVTTGDLFTVIDPVAGVFRSGDACADVNYDGAITTGDLFSVIDPVAGVFRTCSVSCTPIP